MQTETIEIQRNNITVSQFLNYIKQQCNKKNMSCEVDKEYFESNGSDTRYYIKDNKKYYTYNNDITRITDCDDAPCKAEICRDLPYDIQTYIRNHDNTFYNEICEFTFDDEKKGTGYYFLSCNCN